MADRGGMSSDSRPLALVTGAFGFTGAHVARRLLSEGWRVRGLCRRESLSRMPGQGEIEVHVGDLATGEGLDSAPAGAEVIVHAGASVGTSSRAEANAVIAQGTRRLATAAVRQGVRRFVFLSSTAVYGHGALTDANEDTPRRPEDPYGEAKARAEDGLMALSGAGHLQAVVLRPRLIFGAGDRHFLPTVCEALRRRQVVLVDGGQAVNDMVCVDDVAEACVLAMRATGASGRAFNVTSGESLTSREFFEAVADHHRLPRPRLALPYALAWPFALILTASMRVRRGQTRPYSPLTRLRLFGLPHHFSIERARSELGYAPGQPFREWLVKAETEISAPPG